ncbi:hypothetical protein KP509_25G051700 [Ceratopteris richardii]|uniref:Late embryogenesis abundant protein LEA-2 subgroup domain-containing protein n=1 Tax=Ceratopteris richardii TaxID=49495 RepID=A0A8T2RS73_CERRI|nr:hypothetical protein KP509_25G051700 [Ceratopteris richardii]
MYCVMASADASTASAPPVYPPVSDEEEASDPLLGYPFTTVYGYPSAPIPPPPPQPPLFPYFGRLRQGCGCRVYYGPVCAGLSCLIVVLIAVGAFFVWPRSLNVTVDDVSLGKIHFNVDREGSIIPRIYLNLTLNLKLEAANPNYFRVTYETLNVSIFYQDDPIGQVESDGGDIRARSKSSMDATLKLTGYEIASNILSLIADIARHAVPLQTITTFDGHIDVFSFKIPLRAHVSCNLLIDPESQSITSKSCSM